MWVWTGEKNDELVIIENFNMEAPKTKDFVAMSESLKVADKKALWVLAQKDDNVVLSARNLKKASIAVASDLNTYQILNNKCLVLTEDSLASIGQIFNA